MVDNHLHNGVKQLGNKRPARISSSQLMKAFFTFFFILMALLVMTVFKIVQHHETSTITTTTTTSTTTTTTTATISQSKSHTTSDNNNNNNLPPPTTSEISLAYATLQKSNTLPGWTHLSSSSPIPIEIIESSCTWHASELWCVGGYANGETASFDPLAKKWTLRPPMAVKVDHIFNAAVSVNDGKTLAVIGGVGFPPRNVRPRKPFKVRLQLLDTDVPEEEMKWRVVDDDEDVDEGGLKNKIGGMTSCTPISFEGRLLYCYFGSEYAFFKKDKPQFASFDLSSLQFTRLASPPVFYTHVALMLDDVRRRVVVMASREVEKSNVSKEPSRLMYFYDIERDEWNVDDPKEIPAYMPSLEGRAVYQHDNNNHGNNNNKGGDRFGYLFGGHNNAGSWVSETIYKFTLSEDPTDREVHFEWYGRLPGLSKFGMTVTEAPPGSGQLIMVGGGMAVGPFVVGEVWTWDHQRRRMDVSQMQRTAYHLQRKMPGDKRPQPKHEVLVATFGNYDVTKKIQKFLDDGWTHFNSRTMPDLDLLDDWQWLPRKGVHVVTKQSNGKVYRTGWPIWPLAVTLVEPDGWIRHVFCPIGSGCKFSFWDEETEFEVFRELEHFPQWELIVDEDGNSKIQ